MADRRAFVAGISFATAALIVACGGASSSGLFGSSQGDGDAGAAGADRGVPSSGDGDASPSPDATPPPTSGDASLPDTSVPPPPRDASVPDTFVPPGDLGVRCGSSECDPTSSVCCRFGQAPNDSYTCVAAGACQGGIASLPIPCDDATDCTTAGHPGQVCCATLNAQSGRATDVRCRPAQNCDSTDQVIVCDNAATDACPNGGACQASSTSLPGYDICF